MFEGALPRVSNCETWRLKICLTDAETEEAIDIASASIVFEVRDPIGGSIVLSASTGDGSVSMIETGVFEVVFSASLMRSLSPQAYQVGCTMTINGDTKQLIVGEVPIYEGIVTR